MSKLNDLEQFARMSDSEIQHLLVTYDVHLTTKEIRALRPLLQNASLSWLFLGIPADIRKEMKRIVGSQRLQQIEALFLT